MLPDWPELKSLCARAAFEQMMKAVDERHPFLAQIRRQVFHEGDASSYEDVGGDVHAMDFKRVSVSTVLKDEDVPRSDLAAHVERLRSVGEKMSDQLAAHLFKTVRGENGSSVAMKTGFLKNPRPDSDLKRRMGQKWMNSDMAANEQTLAVCETAFKMDSGIPESLGNTVLTMLRSGCVEPPPEAPVEFIMAPEVRERLKVCNQTLWRWEKKRKLMPATRIGRKRLYSRKQVDAFMQMLMAGQPELDATSETA